MLKSHEKFHSANGRRLVLVVDDEMINREILGNVLEKDYEVIFAENGQKARELILQHRLDLSLILLDLQMPVMSGMELLSILKADPQVQHIPVIVLTSDQEAEVLSLSAGASDFIPKPYPRAAVILARVLRTIELSEDRQIINSTERDQLTGLYNRDYFYRYAEQFDQHHQDMEMDAIVVDINHFHMINERFGMAYGDGVLRRIGEKAREMVQDTGGIVCRREADTFLIYCPHGRDYSAILENASLGLAGDDAGSSRVRLRMGVYACVDKEMEIERRFDRAKMAADTVRNSFTKTIGIYDKDLHEKELYAEQLIEDFHTAIREKQFTVHYQPKFDVRPEIPVLSSAEALVRWQHPKLGMISPGVFIPLFEENGLIQELDQYVWRRTAAQIRDWKERLGFAVPVSVNVSRIDMYDPHLIDTLRQIVADNGLKPQEFLLEITESAYTKDSEQIIETVDKLRFLGFRIEMDDFGTGYSSLNMISRLPIDALKLDMQFIRNAFSQKRDTRMLEVIIDIADYLSVPVIAEGVETKEQLHSLRSMGCDLVQGYYFSRPVPPEEYEKFILERRDQDLSDNGMPKEPEDVYGAGAREEISLALASGFDTIFYINAEDGRYVRFSPRGGHDDLQIETSGKDFFGDAGSVIERCVCEEDRGRVAQSMQKEELLASIAGPQPFYMTFRVLRDGSKDGTGDKRPSYFSLKAVRGQGEGRNIVIGLADIDGQVSKQERIRDAMHSSVTWTSIAQALAADYFSIYYVNTETDDFVEYSSREEYRELGIETDGDDFFGRSRSNVRRVIHPDDADMFLESFTKENILRSLENDRTFTLTYRLLFEDGPSYVHLKATGMEDPRDTHIVIGVSNVDEQIRREQEHARILRAANRDALTGVRSRHAYLEEEKQINERISSGKEEAFALAVCDVNGLKQVNDTRGHQEGDRFLCDACRIICDVFKHSPVFRTGGGEFVVLLRGSDFEDRAGRMKDLRRRSCANAPAGGIVIAGGLSDYLPGQDTSLADVFSRADTSMYEEKKSLKTGEACRF